MNKMSMKKKPLERKGEKKKNMHRIILRDRNSQAPSLITGEKKQKQENKFISKSKNP